MMRPFRFVKYYDKASTILAADQMATALRSRGLDARAIGAGELRRERGARLVFVKTSRLDHLAIARWRGCRAVLDVHDTPVFKRRLKNGSWFDGAIFKNRRQQTDFDRRSWRSRIILHQWDPRYGPHAVPGGELRIAYLGDRRSLALFGGLSGVEFVEDDFFARAPAFNCHLSVREPGREALYKPGTKVSTAAACGAVLVTTRDVSAFEMLGPDYPFYCDADRDSIETVLSRVRRELGGASWRLALERLAAVRELTRIERIAEETASYLAALDAVDSGPPSN